MGQLRITFLLINQLVFGLWFGQRGFGGFGVIMVVGGFCLSGCGPMTFVVGVSALDQRLTSTVVEDDGRWFSDRVAVIDVSGILHNSARTSLLGPGGNPVSFLHECLEKARADTKVKAVLLRINTPGGTVTASETMHHMIERFKQQTSKPVVAVMMDVAASGGYYVACAADEILAWPSTITGSIGVIIQTVSFKQALNRLGIGTQAFTSGPNKDAGSVLSTLTDDHRHVFEALVDDFYQRFVQLVRRARPGIPPDRFDELVDGRVVSGAVAVKLGLVDQLGDIHDGFARAKQLAGIDQADLVLYHRPLSYIGSPYAAAGSEFSGTAGQAAAGLFSGVSGGAGVSGGRGTTQINLAQFNFPGLSGASSSPFYYLWHPTIP